MRPFPLVTSLAIALVAGLVGAGPGHAFTIEKRPWMAGAAPNAPPPPGGWFAGALVTSPYTVGLALGYLHPASPFTWKVGANWGMWGDAGQIATRWTDWRLYGALVYYITPSAQGGLYLQAGLGIERVGGGVRQLGWPVIPHIGFGDTGQLNDQYGWNADFCADANGLLSLEAGVLF